jgi:hypothetical protein
MGYNVAMNTPPLKEIVHISRYWSNPQIKVAVHLEGIALEITLEDFCKAVVAEMPHPATVMTRAKLESNVLTALQVALGKVKDASNYV